MSDELDLQNIHNKLDKMTDVLTDVRISQARMEIDISNHIRRTEIAEESIVLLREELVPIKKHVQITDYIWKSVVALSSVLVFLKKMGWLKSLFGFFGI